MTGDWATILAVNLCYVPAGLGVLALLGAPRRLGLAYMAGIASVGVVLTLLLVAGAGLEQWQFLLVCAVLTTPLLRRRRASRAQAIRGGGPIVWLGAGLVAAFLALLLVDLAWQPLWEYDAWSLWTAKAKAIVLFGGLDPTYLRGAISPHYPQLLPALEAVDLRFAGFDTVALHLQFWCLLAGLVAALYDLLRDRVRPVVLWSLLPALVVAPSLSIQTAYAIADVPLACFVALAGVAAMRWLTDGEPADLMLAALFSAAALATKAEGALYVGALGAVLLALAWWRSRRAAGRVALAAAAALVAIVPWAVWASAHGLGNWFVDARAGEASRESPHVSRVLEAGPFLVKEILDPTSWLLLVPVALGAVVLAWRAGLRSEAVLAAGPPAIVLCGLVWIYWHTPFDLHTHLSQSARRVIVALVLYLFALAPLLVEAALRAPRDG